MKRLFLVGSGTLLLVLFLAWWLITRQPKPVVLIQTLTGQPEYCLTCHSDLPEISCCAPGQNIWVRDLSWRRTPGPERRYWRTARSAAAQILRTFQSVQQSCRGSNCHSGTAADNQDHIQTRHDERPIHLCRGNRKHPLHFWLTARPSQPVWDARRNR